MVPGSSSRVLLFGESGERAALDLVSGNGERPA